MTRTFQDFSLRLSGEIPKLDISLAELFLQDAGRDIWDAHQWSFLEKEGVYFTPSAISTGSFSIIKGSKNVTADATAITALTGLTMPLITKRQIRFAGGPLYNIVSFDSGTGAMVLDRIVREETNSTSSYSIYRAYFGYPEDGDGNDVTDFKSFHSIYNPVQGYAFVDLNKTAEWLNSVDPQRTSVNNPIYMVTYKSPSTNAQWEMWPHSQASLALLVSYQARWADFTATSELPPSIPEQLLMERGRFYAYRWADTHRGVHPELAKVNWVNMYTRIDNGLVDNPQGTYYRMLETAKNKDRELFLDMIVTTNQKVAINNSVVGDDVRTGFSDIQYTVEA